MSEPLRDQIAQLRAIMPQLHAVTDESARIVQLVETFLGEECQLGLSVQVASVEGESEDGSDYLIQLEYSRLENQFRLIASEIRRDPTGMENYLSRAPWINCTRELKLRSVELIPRLLDAVAQKVMRTIKQTQESTIKVGGILQQLGIAEKGGER